MVSNAWTRDSWARIPRPRNSRSAHGDIWSHSGDVRLHRFFVQLNPPFRDQNFSSAVHFVVNPARNFTKTRGAFGRNAKKRKFNSVESQSASKCQLNCQLASFEALRSLEKTIDDPTPSWRAVPFLRFVAQNRYPSNCVISLSFSCHIGGTCRVNEFSWSRNGAFFGTEKKGRNEHPHPHRQAQPRFQSDPG